MNHTFLTILNRQEADDARQASSEKLMIAAVEKEFANSREIFDAAKRLSVSVKDFIAGKLTDFPVVPVRKSDDFSIKKHTESQVPYFHCHRFYELIYVHRGKCLQRFKDGATVCLTEGQCLLLCPSAVHSIEKCRRADLIVKLVIPCELFRRTGGKILDGGCSAPTVLFERVSETAEFAILKLLRQQSADAPFKDLMVQSYLTIIFAELVSSQTGDVALENDLRDYFEKNIKTASLAEFAALRNYNANYMSRLIRNRTGKSFSELLRLFRIDRAKRLLTESAFTIEHIAFETGYSNPSGLYKQFFSVVGMKPLEYRNLLK